MNKIKLQMNLSRYNVSWYLSQDAYDAFHCPYSGESEARAYDEMIQLCLMQLMGVPLIAVVGHEGNECWYVTYAAGHIKHSSYFKVTTAQDKLIRRLKRDKR